MEIIALFSIGETAYKINKYMISVGIINEHVCLEIGSPGLDTGNITMMVDIAVMHLDSRGPRSGEILPFLMTAVDCLEGFTYFCR